MWHADRSEHLLRVFSLKAKERGLDFCVTGLGEWGRAWQWPSSLPRGENLHTVREHEPTESGRSERWTGGQLSYFQISAPFMPEAYSTHFRNISLKFHLIILLKRAFCHCRLEAPLRCPMRKANWGTSFLCSSVFCEGVVFILNTPGPCLCLYSLHLRECLLIHPTGKFEKSEQVPLSSAAFFGLPGGKLTAVRGVLSSPPGCKFSPKCPLWWGLIGPGLPGIAGDRGKIFWILEIS